MAAPTLTPEAITALISDRNALSLRVVPGAKVEKAAIENPRTTMQNLEPT